MNGQQPSLWRVYGGQPGIRTFASKRAARKMMRRYARLGIQSSLYSGGDGEWVLSERRDANGQPYRLADDDQERGCGS